MTALLHLHSGLRYLILLLGLINLTWSLLGLLQKSAYPKGARVLGTVFAGTLHLQVTVGIIMVLMGNFYPRLIGHLTMMISAAVLAQVLLIKNRKLPTPGWRLPLLGIGGALLLIIGGIFAIGRSPLQSTLMGG
jgi:heme A synthase